MPGSGSIRSASKDYFKDANQSLSGDVYEISICVKKIGIEGVCEPCALLAGKRAKLIVPKMKLNGLTIAIAREN